MTRSLQLGLLVSLQLLCTFVAQVFVLRLAGVDSVTDAYIAAQAVPLVLSAIVISALQSVWLPRFANTPIENEAWRAEQSSAQGQAAILGGGLVLFLAASAALWLPLLFSGFSETQQELTKGYSLVFFLASAFNTQSALLTAALRARDQFVVAELLALGGTILSVAAIYLLLPSFGIVAAVWIALARAVLVYSAQLALAGWPRLSLTAGWRCTETWEQMRPLLFGASIYKASPLVDRYWASFAPAGGVTTLGLAQSAMGALSTILERALCVPVIPVLSRLAKAGRYRELRHAYRSGSLKLLLLVLALDGALLALKPLSIAAIMMVIRVDQPSAEVIWLLCLILSGYLFSSAAGSLVVSSFYAMGDTKTPVKIGMFGFAAGIVIKSAGFILFQLPGLCFAISFYYLANMAALWLLLEKRLIEECRR